MWNNKNREQYIRKLEEEVETWKLISADTNTKYHKCKEETFRLKEIIHNCLENRNMVVSCRHSSHHLENLFYIADDWGYPSKEVYSSKSDDEDASRTARKLVICTLCNAVFAPPINDENFDKITPYNGSV